MDHAQSLFAIADANARAPRPNDSYRPVVTVFGRAAFSYDSVAIDGTGTVLTFTDSVGPERTALSTPADRILTLEVTAPKAEG